ncbi:MAG TPA: 3-oxoacyl-ACP synthase, partial [Bacteroidia bacterium]|nr:3-oxoacyl-ACP synthase [Bacteroidia bacterium]
MGAFIKAISYYLPEKILTNEELSRIFPQYTPDEIYKRTGIRERHIAGDGELPSDMVIPAFNKLVNEHGIKPEEIDFLIFCSMIPDRMGPATASILQEKLNLPKHSGGIDLPMGCSGYIYALAVANSLIVAGTA